jgi:hypothetical protein
LIVGVEMKEDEVVVESIGVGTMTRRRKSERIVTRPTAVAGVGGVGRVVTFVLALVLLVGTLSTSIVATPNGSWYDNSYWYY